MWDFAIVLGIAVPMAGLVVFVVFAIIAAVRYEIREKRQFNSWMRKQRLRELERWFDATYRD